MNGVGDRGIFLGGLGWGRSRLFFAGFWVGSVGWLYFGMFGLGKAFGWIGRDVVLRHDPLILAILQSSFPKPIEIPWSARRQLPPMLTALLDHDNLTAPRYQRQMTGKLYSRDLHSESTTFARPVEYLVTGCLNDFSLDTSVRAGKS